MKRTTILADDTLLSEAKALAEKQGITFTALVQQALRNYIAMYRLPRRISFAGIVRSGQPMTVDEQNEMLKAGLGRDDDWSSRQAGSSAGPRPERAAPSVNRSCRSS